MIQFFRKIRQNLLVEHKFKKYVIYAIGEIVLVVIGILIALQINNWKQASVENELEKKYLKNLGVELNQDAIGLSNNYKKLQNQARTKNILLKMIKNGAANDSILEYFEYQWMPIQTYIPVKSTYTEMSNNAHLRIIKNDELREKIIKFYNMYEVLEKEEDFLTQSSTRNILDIISKRIPDMSNYTVSDVLSLKSDTYLLNTIQLNGAYTRRDNYKKVITECADLIKSLKKYQAQKE